MWYSVNLGKEVNGMRDPRRWRLSAAGEGLTPFKRKKLITCSRKKPLDSRRYSNRYARRVAEILAESPLLGSDSYPQTIAKGSLILEGDSVLFAPALYFCNEARRVTLGFESFMKM